MTRFSTREISVAVLAIVALFASVLSGGSAAAFVRELTPLTGTSAHFSETKEKQAADTAYMVYLPVLEKDWQGIPLEQMRAIWLQGNTDDATLDKIKAGGFNTVFFLVGSGNVNFNSALLPHSGSSASNDALASMVTRAHARGLKVQAWWCPGYAANSSAFTSQHPTWDIAVASGMPAGTPHWLNFSKPEVRQFVGDVIMEIAENYKVDGVHLDYIRYPAPSSTFTPGKYFSGDDVPNTVQAVYQRLKATMPNVLLTAAVVDYRYRSVNDLQNWQNWLSGNYIDNVIPMAYYGPTENSFLQYGVDWWKTLPHKERIIPGLSNRYSLEQQVNLSPKTWPQLYDQLEQCRTNGFNGFSIFDSRDLTAEELDGLVTYKPN